MNNSILGVDIGGVIIDRVSNKNDTSFFSDNYLKTPQVENAFDVLRELHQQKFPNRIHIVSKCGPSIQKKTKRWLEYHQFTEITGIPTHNLHFCLERKDKAPICTRIGITHFVDDRLDVLQFLSTVEHLYLFKPRDMDSNAANNDIKIIQSWPELKTALSRSNQIN